MEDDTGSQDTSQVFSIGAGLPPVPFKLVRLGNSLIYIRATAGLHGNRTPEPSGDKWRTYWNGYSASVSSRRFALKSTQDMLGYQPSTDNRGLHGVRRMDGFVMTASSAACIAGCHLG